MNTIRRLAIGLVFAISASASTLVGINFGSSGSPSPSGWTLISTSGTVNNLRDTTGASTGISITVNGSPAPLAFPGLVPLASTIPSDAPSLTNLQSNFYNNGGSLTAQLSGLTPNAYYSIYVIGLRFVGTMSQSVTITGAGTPLTFAQSGAADSLFINGSVGSSSQTLESYAVSVQASSSGTITIQVAAGTSSPSRYNVAGIALSSTPVMSPTPLPSSAILLMVGLVLGGLCLSVRKQRLA